jgi:hypothetical protein
MPRFHFTPCRPAPTRPGLSEKETSCRRSLLPIPAATRGQPRPCRPADHAPAKSTQRSVFPMRQPTSQRSLSRPGSWPSGEAGGRCACLPGWQPSPCCSRMDQADQEAPLPMSRRPGRTKAIRMPFLVSRWAFWAWISTRIAGLLSSFRRTPGHHSTPAAGRDSPDTTDHATTSSIA